MEKSVRAEEEPRVRVLVADDHDLYRRGLQMVLGLEDRIEIVAEAKDGPDAVALAKELEPDVVLLDVFMPVITGIEACRQIRAALPDTKILILTMSDEDRDLFAAIKAGANGYLLKIVPAEEVSEGILAIAAGQSLIPPSMASTLLTEFANLSNRATATSSAPSLTEREIEVLQLVAKGMPNKEIAKSLFISENTVKNHVRNILDKLQLHSRMEAALYAIRERIIEAP